MNMAKKCPQFGLLPEVVYAFTINPDDDHQYLTKRKQSVGDFDRLKESFNCFYKLLNEWVIDGIQYRLQQDISLPGIRGKRMTRNQYPRIHYHGYLWFPGPEAIEQFLVYHLPALSLVALWDIDTITDFPHWNMYCNKSRILKGCRYFSTLHYDNTDHIKEDWEKHKDVMPMYLLLETD